MSSKLNLLQQQFYNKWNQKHSWTYIEAGYPASNCINIATSYFFINKTPKLTRSFSFYVPFIYLQHNIILKNSFNE